MHLYLIILLTFCAKRWLPDCTDDGPAHVAPTGRAARGRQTTRRIGGFPADTCRCQHNGGPAGLAESPEVWRVVMVLPARDALDVGLSGAAQTDAV